MSYHVFRCGDVTGPPIGVIAGSERGEDSEAVEDLLVVLSEAEQQLVVQALKVLSQQATQLNLSLALRGWSQRGTHHKLYNVIG